MQPPQKLCELLEDNTQMLKSPLAQEMQEKILTDRK